MSLYRDTELAPPLQQAIAEMGFVNMTPIQEQAIPVVLQGRDVMGAAQTGTGKTAAFALPLLQRMLPYQSASTSPARHPVRALVLLPTRELADQVAQQIAQFARYTQLRSAVVFGGMDIKPQALQLRAGVEVLVATPGRLLDHIEAKTCSLHQVEYVVLDEADRMLDIGFLPDLQRILSFLPKQRTTLLFSATFSPEIRKLSQSYLRNPVAIQTSSANSTAVTVEQHFYAVDEAYKRDAIVQILQQRSLGQAFVFCNSKLGCARLARALERDGLATVALHGDKSQDERLKALDAFKSGSVQLLVATDVAARGLDIKDVPAVFNYDLPYNAEDYVHRIGRTGRAGAQGLALNLVAQHEKRLLEDIEKLLKKSISLESVALADNGHERKSCGRVGHRRVRHDREAPPDVTVREPYQHHGRQPRYKQPAPDPFFDQPYVEPVVQAEEGAPDPLLATDAAAVGANGASGGNSVNGGKRLSNNIRSKRKVAALLRSE